MPKNDTNTKTMAEYACVVAALNVTAVVTMNMMAVMTRPRPLSIMPIVA
jgi:hypothetical protein